MAFQERSLALNDGATLIGRAGDGEEIKIRATGGVFFDRVDGAPIFVRFDDSRVLIPIVAGRVIDRSFERLHIVHDALFTGTVRLVTYERGERISESTPGVQRAVGSGIFRRIPGVVTAAGADFVVPVSDDVNWRVISIHARLVASAVAGNRDVTFNFGDAAQAAFFRMPSGRSQTVSESIPYILSDVGAFNSGLVFGFVQVPIPTHMILPPGFTIFPTTTGLLSGDQWTTGGLALYVEEWGL